MLTVDEKIDILYKIFVVHEYMKDVAKEYRISINVVQSLVSKARGNPRYLDDISTKAEEKSIRK